MPAAAPDRAGRGLDVHLRSAPEPRAALPRGGEPRLRRARRAVERRLLRARPGARAGGDPLRLHRALGGRARPPPARGPPVRARAPPLPDRHGARPRRRPGGGGPHHRRRPVHHHARRPHPGRHARARGRRRRAHRDRRLPLVHGLGPRHDDLAGGPHPLHRPPPGGGLDPAHVRPLRARRPHPEPVPGGREPGPVPHRRRHHVVLPRRLAATWPSPATATRCARSCPPSSTSSTTTSGARISGSASIPRTACSGRARRATSSPGWTPRSTAGW